MDLFFWQGEVGDFVRDDLVVAEAGEVDLHGVVVDGGDIC